MEQAVVIGVALAPAFALLWFFVSRDINPEPRAVLIRTFLFGAATTVPVLIVGPPLAPLAVAADPVVRGTLEAFLLAAVPEEAFKFAVLILYCARHPAFDEPMDGIVYGVTVSLGFAALENVLYVVGADAGWWEVARLRALTAVPGHAALGVVMGHFAQAALFARRGRWLWGGLAFGLPVLLHGLYDAPPLAIRAAAADGTPLSGGVVDDLVGLFLAVFVIEIALALALLFRLRARQRRFAPSAGAPTKWRPGPWG